MIAFDSARQLVLEHTTPITDTETIDGRDALHRVLAEDIFSPGDYPGYDNSAMDGYAVIAADTVGADPDHPVALRIAGEIPAGRFPVERLQPGCAMRIMTGAAIPPGGDGVIMVEKTRENGGENILLLERVIPGDHIRRADEDVRRGQLILGAGKQLRPFELGMLSSLGIESVTVYRQPALVLLTTGDEVVVERHVSIQPGQVRDSIKPMLNAALGLLRLEVRQQAHAPDNAETLHRQIAQFLALSPDVVCISGGISMGKYDLVQNVLAGFGLKEIFYKVAIKPGKPLLFGKIGKTTIFCMPGNPVSSMMSFQLFVKPALLKMMHREDRVAAIPAVLTAAYHKPTGRSHAVRVRYVLTDGRYEATPLMKQGSGMISSLVDANGYIIVDADATCAEQGSIVPLYPFE